MNGVGLKYANLGWPLGTTQWDFEGREIFKQAITGMQLGCEKILSDMGIDNNDVDIVIPHQANLRIIEALAQRLKVAPEKLFINSIVMEICQLPQLHLLSLKQSKVVLKKI